MEISSSAARDAESLLTSAAPLKIAAGACARVTSWRISAVIPMPVGPRTSAAVFDRAMERAMAAAVATRPRTAASPMVTGLAPSDATPGLIDCMEGGSIRRRYSVSTLSARRDRNCALLRAMTTAAPRITIITVVRNGAATLADCIQSVVRQRYPNLEHIIVDGASTDGTQDVIRGFEGRIARWVSEPDQGIYHAMNKATRMATGDWVLFLGAHDWLASDLARMAAHLTAPATIYYGDAYWPSRHRLYVGRFGAA